MKLSKRTSIEILNTCLKTGAEYAEIFYQVKTISSYIRQYRKTDRVLKHVISGVGIRIIKDGNIVHGYTNIVTIKSLMELANELSLAFKGKQKIFITSIKKIKYKSNNNVLIFHDEWTQKKKEKYLKAIENEAYGVSDKVINVITKLMEEDEHIEIYNSNSIVMCDDRTRTSLSISCLSSKEGLIRDFTKSYGSSRGLEFLEDIDAKSIAKYIASISIELLYAKKIKGGELPVVFGNGSGGLLLHEACGHSLEGRNIITGVSPYSSKINTKIASSIVNYIDDGTLYCGWGSEIIDDEGNRSRKNELIKNGYLVNYMVDSNVSNKSHNKLSATGNCRREDFTHLPTTRMTNTFISNGKNTKNEIIKAVNNGIYCVSFSGGRVDPVTNRFMFKTSLAYEIKHGKIGRVIEPISMSGYGYDILKDITMIADDLIIEPATCVSESGVCYVGIGQPTLLVSKILVGGQRT